MPANAIISFQVRPEVKKQADAIFGRMGITTAAAMTIMLMQAIEHRGFPFTVEWAEPEFPNAETAEALEAVIAGEESMRGPFSCGDDLVSAALAEPDAC